MSARYMNPTTSIWASSDSAGWQLVNPKEKDNDGKFQQRQGFSIVESMNPYSYCGNNPINYIDPNGTFLLIDDFLLAIASKLFTNNEDSLFNITFDIFKSSWHSPIDHIKLAIRFIKKECIGKEAYFFIFKVAISEEGLIVNDSKIGISPKQITIEDGNKKITIKKGEDYISGKIEIKI